MPSACGGAARSSTTTARWSDERPGRSRADGLRHGIASCGAGVANRPERGLAHPNRLRDRGAPGRISARLRRSCFGPEGGDTDSRSTSPRQGASQRRHRLRRGLHGRTLVQPGPCRLAESGGAEPRIARAFGRLVAQAVADSADAAASLAAEHHAPEQAEHRRPLRPGQRLLQALPGRHNDVLERGLRRAGSAARRGPAEQVPDHRGARRADCRAARAGDRFGLGRFRGVCRRCARLPRDVRDDLPGAARPRDRTCAGRGPRAPGRHPAPGLPR